MLLTSVAYLCPILLLSRLSFLRVMRPECYDKVYTYSEFQHLLSCLIEQTMGVNVFMIHAIVYEKRYKYWGCDEMEQHNEERQ